MAQTTHLTAPNPDETGWPKGVPYIIGNEGCERFSFYGMKAILQVHLTALFVVSGLADKAAGDHAQEMGHLFMAAVYATPMIGAIIADRLLGKYRTIIWLSLVYCAGHFVLAVAENSIIGMQMGLGLIAIGSGGIKPCVSAHVGDQFGKGNWSRVEKVFQAFYFIINFGSFFSTLLIPYLRTNFGSSVAFGLPGILMLIATFMFWMGRNKFVHVPPNPGGRVGLLDTLACSLFFMGFIALPMFFRDMFSTAGLQVLCVWSIVMGAWVFAERKAIAEDDGFLTVMLHSISAAFSGSNRQVLGESSSAPEGSLLRHWLFASAAKKYGEVAAEGPRAVLRIISVFVFVSVFWALFDQHATSWVRQADLLNLTVQLPLIGETLSLEASQISALNPLMVMALIPFNNLVFYPLMAAAGLTLTPLRKMTIGMLMASLAFVSVALLQAAIETAPLGDKLSILWQIIPYLIMTQAEVMVSITGLEFAYTQAPKRMKSTIMGFWLLVVAFGNVLVALVTRTQNWLLPKLVNVPDGGDPTLSQFFWFFAGLMAIAGALFGLRAIFYRGREYSQ